MEHGKIITPALVAESFGPALFDEAACRRWVVEAMRGAEPVCPFCGTRLDTASIKRVYAGRKVTCAQCQRHSSPRTGTILEGSTLSHAQFVFILAMLHWDLPISTIAAMAGCGKRTVYDWRARLEAMQQ